MWRLGNIRESLGISQSTNAERYRLPALYPFRYFAVSGLMSYGVEMLETYRHAASYVDRVLRG